MTKNALIVLAHPAKTSLAHVFARDVQEQMAANGFNVELLDLYADNFVPALLQVERDAYYAPTPHLTEISRYTDQLSNAEILGLSSWHVQIQYT